MKGSIKKNNKTGNWDFVIDIGNDPKTGKRRQRKRRGFNTKKDAEKALLTLYNNLIEGCYIEPSKQLFEDYLVVWLEGKKHDLGIQTLKSYDSYLKIHIIPLLGKLPIAGISPLHIQHFIIALRTKGLSESTTKRIFSVINNAFNTAVRMELIKKNPATFIDKPKVTVKKASIWNFNEVSIFLDSAKSSQYYIAFILAITTGMRQGEILGLRWKDIDFGNESLFINQTLTHDGKLFKQGAKSSSSNRSIGLDFKTLKLLQVQREKNTAYKLKFGLSYHNNDLIVCTADGKPISPRNLLRSFKSLITKSNLPTIRFHDLRHTHASLLLQQGENIKLISERLGHSNIKITLDTYAHILPNMQREASNRLAEQLFSN